MTNGLSPMTTPEELDHAGSVDLEKLLAGLEARTVCCLEVVPTDCMDASCGHGAHEFGETSRDRENPLGQDEKEGPQAGPEGETVEPTDTCENSQRTAG